MEKIVDGAVYFKIDSYEMGMQNTIIQQTEKYVV